MDHGERPGDPWINLVCSRNMCSRQAVRRSSGSGSLSADTNPALRPRDQVHIEKHAVLIVPVSPVDRQDCE